MTRPFVRYGFHRSLGPEPRPAPTEADKENYQPLPRPEPRHAPETTQAAHNWGEACGRLGLGVPDFAAVTAAVQQGALSDEEVASIKTGRFRACCAGHKSGRRRAGLPALASWERRLEEDIAWRAS